jgi:hypothetical protein
MELENKCNNCASFRKGHVALSDHKWSGFRFLALLENYPPPGWFWLFSSHILLQSKAFNPFLIDLEE